MFARAARRTSLLSSRALLTPTFGSCMWPLQLRWKDVAPTWVTMAGQRAVLAPRWVHSQYDRSPRLKIVKNKNFIGR